MRLDLLLLFLRGLFLGVGAFVVCALGSPQALAQTPARPPALPRTVHVYVALCDNEHQGIVPVRPPELGNGDDPRRNLYWGAMYGVRKYFERSADWTLVSAHRPVSEVILERCVFEHRTGGVFVVADAYRGREIQSAMRDFLEASAGADGDTLGLEIDPNERHVQIPIGGAADLLVYVGHDGLMDDPLPAYPEHADDRLRSVIVLACASKPFFSEPLRKAGAHPLLWTTGLMAPEAYTLKAALDGWIAGETDDEVRERAARAYAQYQAECSVPAARRLLVTGW